MTITGGSRPSTAQPNPAPTEDRSERERVIRDLYGLAAFYVAHPDHPLPHSLSVHHYPGSAEAVQRIAEEYAGGKAPYGSEGATQIDWDLPGTKMPILMISRHIDEQE